MILIGVKFCLMVLQSGTMILIGLDLRVGLTDGFIVI